MASLLQNIVNLAKKTFSKSVRDDFSGSLSELVNFMNDLQATDLNINPNEILNKIDSNPYKGSAPVICVFIGDNDVFSMAAFILRDGSKIPLHDHPNMHGILKVIVGTLKVTSYTLALEQQDGAEVPADRAENRQKDCLIPVDLCMSTHVGSKDKPIVLTPKDGNFHEICAVGGIAVCVDILGPSYDSDERPCNYYNVIESKSYDEKPKIWLCQIPEKQDFWMECADYTRPTVSF